MSWPFSDENREEVEDRFIDLADGRMLFLPRGRGGPVFAVADEDTRLRLSRIYTWVHRGTHLIAIAVALSALRFGHAAAALAVLPAAWLVGWVIEQVAVGGLEQVHDPMALGETAPLEEPSAFAANAFLVAGAALCGAAVWVFDAYPSRTDTAAALALFGITLAIAGFRGIRHAQDATHARRMHPFDNRPIVPR